jgi:hypothetical protein
MLMAGSSPAMTAMGQLGNWNCPAKLVQDPERR